MSLKVVFEREAAVFLRKFFLQTQLNFKKSSVFYRAWQSLKDEKIGMNNKGIIS